MQSALAERNTRAIEQSAEQIESLWRPSDLHAMVEARHNEEEIVRRYVKILAGLALFFKSDSEPAGSTWIPEKAEFWLGVVHKSIRHDFNDYNTVDLINSAFRTYVREFESETASVQRINSGLAVVVPKFTNLDDLRNLLLQLGDRESGIAILPAGPTEDPVMIIYGGAANVIRHRFTGLSVIISHTHGYQTPLVPSDHDTWVADPKSGSAYEGRPNIIFSVNPIDHHVEIAVYDPASREWRFFRENENNIDGGLRLLNRQLAQGKQNSLHMTWLENVITGFFGIFDMAPPEWLINVVISATESGIFIGVEALSAASGLDLLLAPGAAIGFGALHTGRSNAFKAFAADWGLGVIALSRHGYLHTWESYLAVASSQFTMNLVFRYGPKLYPNLFSLKQVALFLHAA